MASIDKVDNVAKASIARINDVPVANIEAVNNTDWSGLPAPLVMEIDSSLLSTSLTMTLGLYSAGSYNFDVDWGDGSAVQTITTYNDPNATHVFPASQKYTVTLQPNTPTGLTGYDWRNPSGTRPAYTSIISFGDVYIDLRRQLWYQCQNINWNTATAGVPNFISKQAINRLFRDADSFTGDLSSWGTASSPIVGTMSELNRYSVTPTGTTPNFNWVFDSTGLGTASLANAFTNGCKYNAPLDNWDVSTVTNFGNCFSQNNVFNQDISMWDTSSATNMSYMFNACSAFTQNLPNWNVSSVTNVIGLFQNASNFNGTLTNWNLPLATSLQATFNTARRFNQPIDQFGITSACTSLHTAFYRADDFNQSLASWDVSGVTSMYRTFRNAGNFQGTGLNNWNTSSCTNFTDTFRNSQSLSVNLSLWDVSSGTSFSNTFNTASVLNTDLRLWDVRLGTNFTGMFQNAYQMAFDLSGWQIHSATTMVNFVGGNFTNNFTDQQCEDAFVAWSNDPLTATNVNATNIWGGRTYPIGGAMQTATTKLTGATYSWTVTGLNFV